MVMYRSHDMFNTFGFYIKKESWFQHVNLIGFSIGLTFLCWFYDDQDNKTRIEQLDRFSLGFVVVCNRV
jgi:hypothetical protein